MPSLPVSVEASSYECTVLYSFIYEWCWKWWSHTRTFYSVSSFQILLWLWKSERVAANIILLDNLIPSFQHDVLREWLHFITEYYSRICIEWMDLGCWAFVSCRETPHSTLAWLIPAYIGSIGWFAAPSKAESAIIGITISNAWVPKCLSRALLQWAGRQSPTVDRLPVERVAQETKEPLEQQQDYPKKHHANGIMQMATIIIMKTIIVWRLPWRKSPRRNELAKQGISAVTSRYFFALNKISRQCLYGHDDGRTGQCLGRV